MLCLRALRAIATPELQRPCLYAARLYSTQPPPPNTSKPTPKPLPYTARPDTPSTPRPDLLDPSARDSDDPIPVPLSRPIGLPVPPQRNTNTGVDGRSWRQRRADFVSYDKHIERRKKLAETLYRPYFRDFSAMRHFKGKTFLSNERLFRGESALIFPNLRGRTLVSEGEDQDTTDVLVGKGRVSVVAVFSSGWAENQVKSFVGSDEGQNPELLELLKGNEAQLVEVNVEPNPLKWWILRAFAYRLRGERAREDWGKYFVVRRGFEEDVREAIGALNSRVGYVYLVDGEGKIRWAGSARAMDDEKESLNRGVRRLIAEAKGTAKVVEKADSVVEGQIV